MQDTLGPAHDQLCGVGLDEPPRRAIEPISDCYEEVIVLRDIFQKVDKGRKDTKGRSIPNFYLTTLLRLGKAHRIESLMQGILRDLKVFAVNQFA